MRYVLARIEEELWSRKPEDNTIWKDLMWDDVTDILIFVW
jgi:hypothetical protein